MPRKAARNKLRKLVTVGKVAVGLGLAAGAGFWGGRLSTPVEPSLLSQVQRYLKLEDDGWRMRFTVDRRHLPAESGVRIIVHDEKGKGNASIVAYKEGVQGIFNNAARADIDSDFTGRQQTVTGFIQSRDNRAKKITVALLQYLGEKEVERPLFETTLYPHGTKVTHGNVLVNAEGNVDKRKLREIAREVNTLYSITSPKTRAGVVYLTQPNKLDKSTGPRMSNAEGGLGKGTLGRETPRVIFGSTNALSIGLHRHGSFHEAAHSLYNGFDNKGWARTLATKYEIILKKAGWKPRPRMGLFGYPLSMEKHPVLSLFDESHYVKGGKIEYGHPGQDEGELFASGSSVMRFFPTEFLKKIRELKTSKPVDYQLALNTANAILSVYGKHAPNVFSKKLIEFVKSEHARANK